LAQKIQEYAERLELSTELNDLVEKLEDVCNQSLIELKNELLNKKYKL
jgi:hypothetical protein